MVGTKIQNEFLSTNFMLHNETAERLFHSVAKPLPIIDYHNHINPHHLAENRKFDNISELWVTGDPYKHRAMRINGIPEHLITGNADPKEKFMQWAKTVSYTVGNPLFHWSALELQRVFDVNDILNEQNAEEIWQHCNKVLQQPDFGAADLIEKCNAEIICTSDELLDDLTNHAKPKIQSRKFKVSPSLRCDLVLVFDHTSCEYYKKITSSTGVAIQHLNDLKTALLIRMGYFESQGCRLADHAIDSGFSFSLPTDKQAETIFEKVLRSEILTAEEVIQIRSHLLVFLGTEYGKRNWAMQLHVGAQRYTSSRLRSLVGPAGGYAAVGKACDIASLCSFLDALEKENNLPRTVLYTLNPADNEAFASLTGSFAQDGIPGKIQFGPAWWYNDHLEGMRKQLTSLASYGLLPRFIGMTTDSRSILSLSRHEYFRRIFCNLLGEWVASGDLPDDALLLDKIVKDVCYNNIKNWFTI